MALSRDLRVRIVDLVASGVSRRQAAARFRVSANSAIRIVKQAHELGHVDVKVRKRRKSKLDPYRSDILGWVADQPDLTLAQLCARLVEVHALRVGSSTLYDWFRRNRISFKKNGTRQ